MDIDEYNNDEIEDVSITNIIHENNDKVTISSITNKDDNEVDNFKRVKGCNHTQNMLVIGGGGQNSMRYKQKDVNRSKNGHNQHKLDLIEGIEEGTIVVEMMTDDGKLCGKESLEIVKQTKKWNINNDYNYTKKNRENKKDVNLRMKDHSQNKSSLKKRQNALRKNKKHIQKNGENLFDVIDISYDKGDYIKFKKPEDKDYQFGLIDRVNGQIVNVGLMDGMEFEIYDKTQYIIEDIGKSKAEMGYNAAKEKNIANNNNDAFIDNDDMEHYNGYKVRTHRIGNTSIKEPKRMKSTTRAKKSRKAVTEKEKNIDNNNNNEYYGFRYTERKFTSTRMTIKPPKLIMSMEKDKRTRNNV